MTTIKQIAQDPRKAMRELESKLGVNPGDLLREMEQLSPLGDESDKHLVSRPVVVDKRVRQGQFGIKPTEQDQ